MQNINNNFYEKAFYIDKLLVKPTKENINRIKELIEDEALLYYFVTEIIKKDDLDIWILPLKKSGFFTSDNLPTPKVNPRSPETKYIPYWKLLDILERLSVNYNNAKNTKLLMSIIDPIISYILKEQNKLDNYFTLRVLSKILISVSFEKLNDKHYDFLRYLLNAETSFSTIGHDFQNDILPKILKTKNSIILCKFMNIILDYQEMKSSENRIDKVKSIMDGYYLADILKNNYADIYNICGIQVIYIVINKIIEVLSIDESRFDIVTIPSIENSDQRWNFNDYEELTTDFLRDLMDILKKEKDDKFYDLLFNFSNSKYDIFKRLTLYFVDNDYNLYKDIFWNNIYDFLNNPTYRHELYHLLKHNNKSFTKKQLNIFLKWLDNKNFYENKEIEKDRKKLIDYNTNAKRRLISAIEDNANSKVQKLIEKYNRIDSSKIDRPDYLFWHGDVHDESVNTSISIEKIKEKTLKEIVEDINSYRGKKDYEIILNLTSQLINENPEIYINELDEFINTDFQCLEMVVHIYIYTYNKIKYDLIKLFNFIIRIFEEKDYIAPESEFLNYNNRMISDISEFIERNTKNDDNPLEKSVFLKIEPLLIIMFRKINEDIKKINDSNPLNDIFTKVLNSTKGKLLTATINYSLQNARLYIEKNNDFKWIVSIREEFSKRLNKEYDNTLDFSTALGWYLPQLNYLDKKWVEDNLNSIFPMDSELHWEAAISGFLYFNNKIYRGLYNLLKSQNHFTKAISYKFVNKEISKACVEYICFGFVNKWEDLENANSLFFKLINRKDPVLLYYVVSFLSTNNQLFFVEKNVVRKLWKNVFKIINHNLDDEHNQKTISELIRFYEYFEEIDDEMLIWLKTSCKYIGKNNNLGRFYKIAKVKVQILPGITGELLYDALCSHIVDFYSENEIEEIVKNLYLSKDEKAKNYADKICNLFGSMGYYKMKEVYKENNPNL